MRTGFSQRLACSSTISVARMFVRIERRGWSRIQRTPTAAAR